MTRDTEVPAAKSIGQLVAEFDAAHPSIAKQIEEARAKFHRPRERIEVPAYALPTDKPRADDVNRL